MKDGLHGAWHVEIYIGNDTWEIADDSNWDKTPCYIKDGTLYARNNLNGNARIYNGDESKYWDFQTKYEKDGNLYINSYLKDTIKLHKGEKDTKHEGWFTRSLACRDIYRK